MPKFVCSDIGMDCGFEIKAATKEELLQHIGNHAKIAHNLDPIPSDTLEAVKNAITEDT